MRYFGQFLSNLRSSANLSLEELAKLTDTSRSTISRIENSEVSQPFKGPIRKLLICAAEILCTSRTETERYLNLANIDKSTLPEIEQIQLGFTPKITKGSPDEITDLERLEKIYEQLLKNLETKEQELGVSDAPPNLKLKTQEYRNTLQEIRRRLDTLQNRDDSENIFTTPIIQAHAQPLENIGGRIVVGNQYGEHQNNILKSSSLYTLASANARWLMQLANVERFAVDDCIILANSEDAVEDIKVLSLSVEYLTLSVDVIMLIKLNLEAEEIKQNWLLRARHREEASRFDTISTELTRVLDKALSRTLWHPTSRMRLLQFLFHTYGIDATAKIVKEKQKHS